ncbi:Glycosyl hydrolases family 2, TIM barrel domain [Ruminococcaceae bacterium YRB3002]|nr:Glycosyl hydrolases family 2, TIM barrel domain [Ruminococcaceae bacterium YRB3002]
MDLKNSNEGFWPYESFDYIFADKEQPEFGRVKSPFVRNLATWRFMLAPSEQEMPFGFESPSFDDSDWDLINCPSTWQTEGYGLPSYLLYNYPETLEQDSERRIESISDKYLLKSTDGDDDEIGIYRTSLVFKAEDINRAIYLEMSGICGRFAVYVNSRLVLESHAVNTPKRLLLSDNVHEGLNHIVIAVYRYDRSSSGHIINDYMNFGFSGIFRPIYIVEESLLEINDLHIQTENLPEAYLTEIANINLPVAKDRQPKIPRGNYMVKIDFEMVNHTDIYIPYTVNVSVIEARHEYDPYNLPYVKIRNQQGEFKGVLESNSTGRVEGEIMVLDVGMWSDATPIQYDLIIELLDQEGAVICAKRRRFGFRSVSVVQDKININDRRVTVKAVRYFEFDAKGGITIPRNVARHDIILMKRAGINCLFCSGLPASDEVLDLADQYGMYVVILGTPRVMEDAVSSLMNHPSVIMWGISDYKYDVSAALEVKQAAKKTDPTRPWYCNADLDGKVSDMLPFEGESGAIFGPWQDLCLDRKEIFAKNKSEKNLFETIPGRTRFADDGADYKWIHHADLVGGKHRADSSIGQGIVDVLRNPHPIYLDIRQQCNDLQIFTNEGDPTNLTLRNTNPFAYSEEMELEWRILLGGKKLMSGRGLIGEIEPYGTKTLRFPIKFEQFAVPGWAKGKQDFIELYMTALSQELIFDISLKLEKDTYYASKGFEMAFFQEVIMSKVAPPVSTDEGMRTAALEAGSSAGQPRAALPAPEGAEAVNTDIAVRIADVEESHLVPETVDSEIAVSDELSVEELREPNSVSAMPTNIFVGNDMFRVGFSRRKGSVNAIMIDGFNFLNGTFMPSFYRCPSNIDRTDRNFVLAKTVFSKESDYEEIQESLEFKRCEYSMKDGVFGFIAYYGSFAMKGDVIMYYEVARPGVLKVTLDFTPKYDMVRYGVRFPLVKDETVCTWYGRGPGESYYDRKNATKLGLFAAETDKMYHAYARPAENSAHADTLVVKISNTEGSGFLLRRAGDARFDFTVLPFTPEQMNEYLHEEQLMKNDFCELFADFCSKEIERTENNLSALPLKKNVHYRDSFLFEMRGKDD